MAASGKALPDPSKFQSAGGLMSHIPEAERLVHAVAVLIQGQTLPATGVELERNLERLLCIDERSAVKRRAALRGNLALDNSSKAISELSGEEAVELILHARDYAKSVIARLRRLMEAKHGSLREALRLFRRNRHGDQRLDTMHLVDTSIRPEQSPGFSTTYWSEALAKLGMESDGMEGFAAALQLLGGGLKPEVLPYVSVVLRLGGLPISALVEFRQHLITKYRTLPRMFSMIGDDQAIYLESFKNECAALPQLRDHSELLFAACDQNCGGSLDAGELQSSLCVAAPSTSLQQLRRKVLLRWGSWQSALSELGISLDNVVSAASLIALAAHLDICCADMHDIFRQIESDSGCTPLSWEQWVHHLSQSADGFTLQELSLRLWLACESGTVPADRLARLQVPGDSPLSLERFASAIFGIQVKAHASEGTRRYSAAAACGRKSLDGSQPVFKRAQSERFPERAHSGRRKPEFDRGQRILSSSPPLTEAELVCTFHALRQKYRAVTLNALRRELESHHFVGEVLALDRGEVFPGETIIFRYRVPHSAQQQLLEQPFVGIVPRALTWHAGGGGSWTIGKKQVTDFPWSKVLCKNHREGALQVQIPTSAGSNDVDSLEFRLFASPDGSKVGKQVGESVTFNFRLHEPCKPMVSAEALTPTSLRLFWDAVGDADSGQEALSYMVRGWPVGLQVEEIMHPSEDLQATIWSHREQAVRNMHCHEVRDLVPGLTYCFQVSALQHFEEHQPHHQFYDQSHQAGKPSLAPVVSPSPSRTPPRALSPRPHPQGDSGLAEGPSSETVAITLPTGPQLLEVPGAPILVERGLGGHLTLKWAICASGIAEDSSVRTSVVDFCLLWDVPDELLEPRHFRSGRGFWQFPGQYWMRKIDPDTVECLARLPSKTSTASACFCVAAGSGDVEDDLLETVSEPGLMLPLLSGAEEVFRDPPRAQALGEIAVAHGGLPSLLEAMADAGLTGDASKDHYANLRQALKLKVAEVGGLDAFLGCLQGIDTASFEDACSVLRSIQRHSGKKVDAPAWENVFALVGDGGGPSAFANGLGELSIRELIAAGPGLAKAGLVRHRTASPDDKGVLCDPRRAEILGVLADCFDTTAICLSEVQSLTEALSTMLQAGGDADDWSRCMNSVLHSGGPGHSAELLDFADGKVLELLSGLRASGIDVQELRQLMTDLQAASFVGPGSDRARRHAFLRRLADAGGLPVLYRLFQGFDFQSLEDGIQVLQAAGLWKASQDEISGKANLWCQLVDIVQHDWGGIEATLERFTDEAWQQENSRTARKNSENKALLQIVENNGGASSVKQLLLKMNVVGGAEKFLSDLGNLDIGYIPPILRDVRKLGCSLVELERLLQCTNQAGGVSRMLASLHEVQDLGRLPELISNAVVMEKQLEAPDIAKCAPAAQGAILHKVLGDMAAESFLQAFTSVNLGVLATLVPLLTSAGLLQMRDKQRTGTGELGETVEQFLRWTARAGGAQRLSAALDCVDARLFTRCMDIIRSAGIGRMSEASLQKTSNWLERDVKPGGGLELLIDCASGIDLFRACALMVRMNAASQDGQEQKEAAEMLGSIPLDRLVEAQRDLEHLVDIAVMAGGVPRLVKLLSRLDVKLLEPMVDHLEAFCLNRPSNASQQINAQDIFGPWVKIASLTRRLGGPANFYQKAVAVDLMHFDECLKVLHAAGLSHPVHGNHPAEFLQVQNIEEQPPASIAEWRDAVKTIATCGGPCFFLESLRGVDLQSFLEMMGMLRKAGLALDVDKLKGEKVAYKRLLQEFVEKACEAGGFNSFWHLLKSVDLRRLRDDLYCLGIIRRRLSSSAACPEDMWLIVTDPDRLDALLFSVGKRRQSEDFTSKQRERIMRKLRNVGGVDKFLEEYETVDLSIAVEQLRALEKGGVSSPEVISELAKLGQLVQHDLTHLKGLGEVVGTLVKWIQNRDVSDAASLWYNLNEQVVWLLKAITENSAMVHAVSKRCSVEEVQLRRRTGQEPELTPARLAQLLQALRPLGGVRGFLSAYRGLDLPTAAAQARVLYDASVRTVDTAKRLANLFRLLHHDSAQLRGLEHFVRRFAATVMVGDKLKVGERWEALTYCLKFAADGNAPGLNTTAELTQLSEQRTMHLCSESSFSGPDQVRDVLALGLQLSKAAGLDAVPEDWVALCAEIRERSGRLGDVLKELRGTQGAKAATVQAVKFPVRQRPLHCSRCGTRMPQYHRAAMPRACSLGTLRSVGAAKAESEQQSVDRSSVIRSVSEHRYED